MPELSRKTGDEDMSNPGMDIQRKSFEIIRGRIKKKLKDPGQEEIMIRIAHTTGDVTFAETFCFHPEAIQAGLQAIKGGACVVTDVGMVKAGIREREIKAAGGRVECYLYHPDTAEEAAKRGTTKSAAAMRLARQDLEGGIVAIGNAPTALFELLAMVKEGLVKPALVVGVPVGFVGAAESKERLMESPLVYISNHGERGGSPIAAAVINGFASLAVSLKNE